MKYHIRVWTGEDQGNEKLHYTINQKQLDNIKRDVIKTNYDGSFNMKNGDIIEVEVA